MIEHESRLRAREAADCAPSVMYMARGRQGTAELFSWWICSRRAFKRSHRIQSYLK